MDDIKEKLSQILSDKESMKQLSELAEMLMSEDKNTENTEKDAPPTDMPDMNSLMKLSGLMSEMSRNDKNSELLLALKPHLSDKRQQKLDKAVKLMRLVSVIEIAKENGLLNDMI